MKTSQINQVPVQRYASFILVIYISTSLSGDVQEP